MKEVFISEAENDPAGGSNPEASMVRADSRGSTTAILHSNLMLFGLGKGERGSRISIEACHLSF